MLNRAWLLGNTRRQRAAVTVLDFLVREAPPGTPSTNEKIIVAQNATGAFATKENQVARWNGVSWDFVAPVANQRILIRSGTGVSFGVLKYFSSYGIWLPDDTKLGGASAFELEGPAQQILTPGSPAIEVVEFTAGRLTVGCSGEPGTQGVVVSNGGTLVAKFSCLIAGNASGDNSYSAKIDVNGTYVATHTQIIIRNTTAQFDVSYSGAVIAGDQVGFTCWREDGAQSGEAIGSPKAMGRVD